MKELTQFSMIVFSESDSNERGQLSITQSDCDTFKKATTPEIDFVVVFDFFVVEASQAYMDHVWGPSKTHIDGIVS